MHRYAFRTLRNNPGFTAVAILTTALGIGANTAIFSVVYAVLLRPLPYADPARLVTPANLSRDSFITVTVGDFQYAAWRDQSPAFDAIALYTNRRFTITGRGDPEQLHAAAVSPGFLHTLGVSPIIGRDFSASDAAPRLGGRVAIITHRLWMNRFGGDRSILSQHMTLEGNAYSIAGVLPRTFEFPGDPDVSFLIAVSEPPSTPIGGGVYFYNVLARLKRGVTAPAAAAGLRVINQRLAAAYPKQAHSISEPQITTLQEKLVGNIKPAVLALAGAVGLVLLIVCVNVSSLLLARAISRQKEIAVRIALGAGRAQIFRQLLAEGVLLSSAGGVAGLALAIGGVKLLRAIAPAGVPHIEQVGVGLPVLAFNLAIALCTGILFGIAPLRLVSGVDPEAALKQATRSATGSRSHRRLENLLIVSEVAFALILLAGAGLLLRTFAAYTAIAPGFRPDNVVTARVSLPYWKYRGSDRQRAVFDQLLERVRSGPGVDAAALVSSLPYGGFVMMSAMEVEGNPSRDENAEVVPVNFVSGDYFRAMGIPILEGRAIDSSDRAGSLPVAVVNDTLIKRLPHGQRALGSRIRIHGVTGWMEIVGVVRSVKQNGLASQPRPEVWQPVSQSNDGNIAPTLAVHSTAASAVLIPWLRSQIAAVDPDLPAPEILTMRARMATLIASQVFVMRLLAVFALIATGLAAIGMYSVLVYSVERRAHEIGIRIALGARRPDIVRLIVGRGLRLTVAGATLGVAGALGLTRYLESLLYGVKPHDPATLAAGCTLLILTAVASAWLPARKATGQDATITLRAE